MMSNMSAAVPPTSSVLSARMQETDLEPTHLKALSHPIRWQLVWLLEQQEPHLCVFELTEHIQGVSLVMISYHLGCLRKAGWVESQKQGRNVYYSLKRERFEAVSHLLALLSKPGS